MITRLTFKLLVLFLLIHSQSFAAEQVLGWPTNVPILVTGATGVSVTNGNCAEFDSDGNIVDSGTTCGGGGAYSDSADPVILNTTTKDVIIAGAAQKNTSKATIDGDTDQVQLTIQGHSTQTNNILVVEESDGTDILTASIGGIRIAGGIQATELISCNTIDTNSLGVFSCGIDGGGAGGGDNVTVNGSVVDTTANFLDGDIDWSIADGGAGGPDDITGTVACSGCIDVTDMGANSVDSSELVDGGVDLSHMSSASVDSDNIVDNTIDFVDIKYDNTLAENPALAVDECYFIATATGGGFICEGSTANTNEQLYKFPDADGADTTENIAIGGGAFHDGFSDFVANEHINHTSVTLTAGVGISGGGDISSNRTFTFDATEIDAVTWSDAVNASNIWTFDVSGTNVTVTWGNATATIVGVVVADGLTLGANENVTLGAETLDHNSTNFVFSDSVLIDGSDNEIQLTVQGNATQTTDIFVVEESDGTDIMTGNAVSIRVHKDFSVGGAILLGDGGDSFSLDSDTIDINTLGEITNTPKITVTGPAGDSAFEFNNTTTADPCGTGTAAYDTGALFFSSGGFFCYCDDTATSVDLLVSSNGACTY